MNQTGEELSEIELMRALFGGKWRYDVIRHLCDRPQRLSNLERLIPIASKKMLIDTLHALEARRWIERRDQGTDLRRVEYALSAVWTDRLRFAVKKMAGQK